MIDPKWRGSKCRIYSALATDEGRARALAEIEDTAETDKKTNESLWNTWVDVLNVWGEEPLPLNVERVKMFAASMRVGGYRSAEPYMIRARTEHVRRYDQVPGPAVMEAIKRYSRAVERGVGPTKLKDSILLEDTSISMHKPSTQNIQGLDAQASVWPGALFCMGAWWMTRGIEASAARTAHIRFDHKRLSSERNLPASKTDIKALGASRAHTCTCSSGNASERDRDPICPFHIALDNMNLVYELFGSCTSQDHDLPLFPNAQGQTLSHRATVEAIRKVAKDAGESTTKIVHGFTMERFGEHLMRVAGAQFLARKGVELYIIQLIGRWGHGRRSLRAGCTIGGGDAQISRGQSIAGRRCRITKDSRAAFVVQHKGNDGQTGARNSRTQRTGKPIWQRRLVGTSV